MSTHKKAPSCRKGLIKNNLRKNNSKDYTKIKAIKLPKKEADRLVAKLSTRAKQGRRLLAKLCANADVATNKLNNDGGVNLSNVAKNINKKISEEGYVVRCKRPKIPIKNSFDEDSGQQLWGIVKCN